MKIQLQQKMSHIVVTCLAMTLLLLTSCGGGGDATVTPTAGAPITGLTGVVSLTGIVSVSTAGRNKISASSLNGSSKLKQALRGNPAPRGTGINLASVQLYDAHHPEWTAPIAIAATDTNGNFSLTAMVNAASNLDSYGNPAYVDAASIPSGDYTLFVSYRDPQTAQTMSFISPHVQSLSGVVQLPTITLTNSTISPQVQRVASSDLAYARTNGVTISANANIEVLFNHAVEPGAARRITLKDALNTSVSGTWNLNPDWQVATFSPTANLSAGTYTLTVPSNVTDIWQNNITTPETITVTVQAVDTLAPTFVDAASIPNSVNSTLNLGSPIILAFSEAMDAFSLSGSLQSSNPSRSVGALPEVYPMGIDTYGHYLYRIEPSLSGGLVPGSTYEILIQGGATAVDMAGNILQNSALLTFTMGSSVSNSTTAGATAVSTSGTAVVATAATQGDTSRVVGGFMAAIQARDSGALLSYFHPAFAWWNIQPSTSPGSQGAYDINQDTVLDITEANAFFNGWFSSMVAPITASATVNWMDIDPTGTYALVGLNMNVTDATGSNGPTAVAAGQDNIIMNLYWDGFSWLIYDLWDVQPVAVGTAPTIGFQQYFSLSSPVNGQTLTATGSIPLSWTSTPSSTGSSLLLVTNVWDGRSMAISTPGSVLNVSLAVDSYTHAVTVVGGTDISPQLPGLTSINTLGRLSIQPGDQLLYTVMSFSAASLGTLTDASLWVTDVPTGYSDAFTFTYGTPISVSVLTAAAGPVDPNTGQVILSGTVTAGATNVDVWVYGNNTNYFNTAPLPDGTFTLPVYLEAGLVNRIDVGDNRGGYTNLQANATAVTAITYAITAASDALGTVSFADGYTIAGAGARQQALTLTVGSMGTAASGVPVHIDAWGWSYTPIDAVTNAQGQVSVTIPMQQGEWIFLDITAGTSAYMSLSIDNSVQALTTTGLQEVEPNDSSVTGASWDPTSLPISGSLARINAAGAVTDVDYYRLRTVVGNIYNIWTEILNNTPDTILTIYDASGAVVTSNDDTLGLASSVTFTDTGSGPYDAVVTAFGSGTFTGSLGNYNLAGLVTGSVSQLSPQTRNEVEANTVTVGSNDTIAMAETRALASNDVLRGAIAFRGDTDVFTMTLQAGDTLALDTEIGQNADTVLELQDANGIRLAYNDDWNGLASHIDYINTGATQTVYVLVTAYANAYPTAGSTPGYMAYNLSASVLGGVTLATGNSWDLEPNDYTGNISQPVVAVDAVTNPYAQGTGTFATFCDNDTYKISVQGNAQYNVFTVTGGAWSPDTFLDVSYVDANGLVTWLASNDNATGVASSVTVTAPSTAVALQVSVSDILCQGASVTPNNYELHVDFVRDMATLANNIGTEIEANNTAAAANALVMPSVVSGDLFGNTTNSTADEDWFVISGLTPFSGYYFSTGPTSRMTSANWTDTVLEVYELDATGTPVMLASNDDTFGLWSQVAYNPTASTVYIHVRPYANRVYNPINTPNGQYLLTVDTLPLYKSMRPGNKPSWNKGQIQKSMNGTKVIAPRMIKGRSLKAWRQKVSGPVAQRIK